MYDQLPSKTGVVNKLQGSGFNSQFITKEYEANEGRYSVSAAFETALLQTHSRTIDVFQQNCSVVVKILLKNSEKFFHKYMGYIDIKEIHKSLHGHVLIWLQSWQF